MELGAIRCWSVGGRLVCAYAGDCSRDDRLAALKLFPGTTLKRRGLYAVMNVAVRLGLDRLFAREVDTGDPQFLRIDVNRLLTQLRVLYGDDAITWLITWPAMVSRQRLYMIYHSHEHRRQAGVVKIGIGAFNVRQLENESEMLTYLSRQEIPFAVPRVKLKAELADDVLALVLDGFPATHCRYSEDETRKAVSMVCRALRQQEFPRKRLQLKDTGWYQDIANLGDDPQVEVEVGFAHGDLGPGNLTMTKDQCLLIYDWENASCEAPLATDQVGFWLALNQRELLSGNARNRRRLRDVFCDIDERELRLALLYLASHGNMAALTLLDEVAVC